MGEPDQLGLASSKAMGLMVQSSALLQRFLEYTDPSLLPDRHGEQPLDLPITQWDTLYSSSSPHASTSKDTIQPSIVVRCHPASDKHLFSVQSVIPGIDARQFWSLMANGANRSLWDSTVEVSNVHYWLADRIRSEDSGGESPQRDRCAEMARRLSARVEVLRFGSIMFVANKRDMVLLSIDTQLPSPDGRLRLLSTSTSIDEASLPTKKGYNRFQLHIGGFLLEDVGGRSADGASNEPKGIRVTQLSDLGEMASWVPASIIKMVASTMVPRSMNAIAKAAGKLSVPRALSQGSGDGYSGEGEGEEERLSEGGGTWPLHRRIPPIWAKRELNWGQRFSLDGVHCDCFQVDSDSGTSSPPLSTSRSEPGSSEFTLQKLSLPLSGQEEQARGGHDHEDDSESGDSLSMAPSSPRARLTMVLDSGTETAPGSPRSSMSGGEQEREGRLGEQDATLRFAARVDEQDEEVANSQAGGPGSKEGGESTEENESLSNLFCEERKHDCSQILSRHTQTFSRLSMAQKERQRRISTMLVTGSDAIAMAIAPGARDSMASVARIMDVSLADDGGEGGEGGEGSGEEQSEHNPFRRRLGSSTSAIAPPTTTTAHVGGTINARPAVASPSHPSRLQPSSTGDGKHSSRTASSASWTSSITEAPYTLAIGILHLATWAATRPLALATLPDTIGEEGQEQVGAAVSSKPTTSALSVARRAYEQRNLVKEKASERPRSHYRVDDAKLHPFPQINSEELPPLGIATGAPAQRMHCEPAKQGLHEPHTQQRRPGWFAPYW